MAVRVRLKDIVDAVEMQLEESTNDPVSENSVDQNRARLL